MTCNSTIKRIEGKTIQNMKLANWFKITWWILILSLTTTTLAFRFHDITIGKSVSFDTYVFIIWVAIMLAPLFQEISFFGIQLKQSIDELKGQINEVKNEIHNKITFNPTINLIPTGDNKIQELEVKYSNLLDKILETKGKKTRQIQANLLNVPRMQQFLFASRYRIENELRRIWEQSIGNSELRRTTPLIKLLKDLIDNSIISNEIYHPLREVIAITNFGIHGEVITENQFAFVKDIAPKLIATLEEVK